MTANYPKCEHMDVRVKVRIKEDALKLNDCYRPKADILCRKQIAIRELLLKRIFIPDY